MTRSMPQLGTRAIQSAAARLFTSIAKLSLTLPIHPNAALLDACAADAAIHRALATRGARTNLFADCTKEQAPSDALSRSGSRVLRQVAATRPITAKGHQARAAAFLLWDDGVLLGRARREKVLEDVVLAAIIVDLVTVTPSRTCWTERSP